MIRRTGRGRRGRRTVGPVGRAAYTDGIRTRPSPTVIASVEHARSARSFRDVTPANGEPARGAGAIRHSAPPAAWLRGLLPTHRQRHDRHGPGNGNAGASRSRVLGVRHEAKRSAVRGEVLANRESARGAEGHGTPPRLRRGCVPYYQHTSNGTQATTRPATAALGARRGTALRPAGAGLRALLPTHKQRPWKRTHKERHDGPGLGDERCRGEPVSSVGSQARRPVRAGVAFVAAVWLRKARRSPWYAGESRSRRLGGVSFARGGPVVALSQRRGGPGGLRLRARCLY